MPYRLVFGAQLRENAALRQSFFSLAEQIFGISFAEWHRGGYWQQSYLPYALVEGEEVIANVSVNAMEFLRFGERKRYVQLGTVMTAPRFRGQGLARQLLEHVLLEWESRCQGIYLYANDTVLNFYPKFGFQPQEEYAFFFPLSQRPGDFSRIDPCTKEGEALLRRCYRQGNPFSCCSMQENFSLLMFYCGASLRNDIYYSPGRDATGRTPAVLRHLLLPRPAASGDSGGSLPSRRLPGRAGLFSLLFFRRHVFLPAHLRPG